MKLSLRKDEVKAFTDQERLFCHANRMEDGHVVVPRVMGLAETGKTEIRDLQPGSFCEGSQNLETVIGMEIHVELKTLSKMFCACSTQFGARPNENTCPICMGMPGTWPVLNREAVRLALRAGRALNCEVNRVSRFDRKNYTYPDLPKGCQITQFDLPLCENGHLDIDNQEKHLRIGIERIHLEEDAGKLIHPENRPVTLVDYNRAGVPLIEIVTHPEAISPRQAVAFLKELKRILEYTEVSDCRMEQGSLRCDVNLSVRRSGEKQLGTKVEIKNLNSFKEIQRALEWEQQRQQGLLKSNRPDLIRSETRRWDDKKGMSFPMRMKNGSQQYSICPDPDLPPLDLRDEELQPFLEESLPELPRQKRARFSSRYGLSIYEANVLTESKFLAEYYEEVVDYGIQPKEASNWILAELLRLWKHTNQPIAPVDSSRLAELIKLVEEGTISRSIGKEILDELVITNKRPQLIVEERGLNQVSDRAEIESLIQDVLDEHQGVVEDYRKGKIKAAGYLMGQIMKAGCGKVNPQIAKELLQKMLAE
jgi:aspartyl-tRNA(Asn)/glutamyl-tRNA(Gln) amidotransferase subunit B